MSFVKALEKVSEIYVPGAVKFFASMNPDPWIAVHERLEADILLHGLLSPRSQEACDLFVAECEKLLGVYRTLGIKPKATSTADAFVLGANFKAVDSQTSETCVICESKNDLKLVKHEGKICPMCLTCSKDYKLN